MGKAAGTTRSMLGFESGDSCWLVDIADAGEVLPVPVVTAVPLTRAWFLGLANIRGTLYGVTDLAAFHGGDATPIRAETRVLLAGGSGSNAALLMSRTLGLKAMSALEAMPAEAPAQQAWRGEQYRDGEGRTWTRLLLPALLNATQFIEIAA